jgi:hypothetical protein
VQEKKVRVFELIPINLFNKVKKIIMMSLSILYNTNPVPLAICALPPPRKPKQQGPDAKKEL